MEGYYEARQHLNLSNFAYNIIDVDKFTFQEKPSFTQMINRIFETYRDYADASIENACANYIEQLEVRLEAIPESSEKKNTINALADSYKERLIETANSYPRECPFKVQMNKQNFEYLASWRDTEGAYDDVPGRFIKAVLEEYSRKPFVERESIIFRSLIEKINYCIETHSLISITLYSGSRYEVRPYKVLIDQGNNYHYLVGYSCRERTKEETPSSFRVSNIKECEPKGGRSGRITEQQKKELESKIRSVGVQFLLQNTETIRVRLSKYGKRMYESQIHLRPAFSKREALDEGSWIYEFNCTQLQAQYYFFKFGPDAEVLSPESLRKRFSVSYEKALLLYSMNDNEIQKEEVQT